MKPIYLLDTNVISEFSKLEANQILLRKVRERGSVCAICATVWQESVYGYESLPEGKRKARLGLYLRKIKESYPILPYDDFAAQICGELQARCKARGFPASKYDAQIAATAIANGMVLITHNTADFAPLREVSMLHLEDWWE